MSACLAEHLGHGHNNKKGNVYGSKIDADSNKEGEGARVRVGRGLMMVTKEAGDEECNDEGGNSDGDSNREGKGKGGKGGKRDGNGHKEGKGEGGKRYGNGN